MFKDYSANVAEYHIPTTDGKSRGFAFVIFKDKSHVMEAQEMNGVTIEGRTYVCHPAKIPTKGSAKR